MYAAKDLELHLCDWRIKNTCQSKVASILNIFRSLSSHAHTDFLIELEFRHWTEIWHWEVGALRCWQGSVNHRLISVNYITSLKFLLTSEASIQVLRAKYEYVTFLCESRTRSCGSKAQWLNFALGFIRITWAWEFQWYLLQQQQVWVQIALQCCSSAQEHSPGICFVTVHAVNKDRLFLSMTKGRGIYISWQFRFFMIHLDQLTQIKFYDHFPIKFHLFQKDERSEFVRLCLFVLSGGHSDIFWVWQHHWLFWLVLYRMRWDRPLPAPCLCCNSKYFITSTNWHYTRNAVQKRRIVVVVDKIMLKLIQSLFQ